MLRNKMDEAIDFEGRWILYIGDQKYRPSSSVFSGTFTFGCTSETVSPTESHPKQDLKHQSAEVPTILPFDSHLVGVKCPFMVCL